MDCSWDGLAPYAADSKHANSQTVSQAWQSKLCYAILPSTNTISMKSWISLFCISFYLSVTLKVDAEIDRNSFIAVFKELGW